jgi:phosphatidylinositol alpha-mannosyltransferase
MSAFVPECACRRLRVLVVAPYDLSMPGGVSAHIRAQARALRRRGHSVQIVGPASRPAGLVDGEIALGGAIAVNIQGTVSGLGLNPFRARAVRSLLHRTPLDVVHIHEPLTPVLPWLFTVFGEHARIGTFHVHRETGHRAYAASAWALRLLVRRLDARIAVSSTARGTVARYFPGRYEVIPNGIDVNRFRQVAEPPAGWPTGDRTVLFVGRIEGRKGLPTLIEAMPLVQRRVPNARLVVVGDGPDREDCERLADARRSNALFLGRVTDQMVPAAMQAAEIFCSPAMGGESFGVVLLEAMASGTPVIASAIDGYEQVVQTGVNGLLAPPGDPTTLADALIRLFQDQSLQRSLCREGHTTAEQYDWNRIAIRLEAAYRRVLSARMQR